MNQPVAPQDTNGAAPPRGVLPEAGTQKSPAQQFNENMGQLLTILIKNQHHYLRSHFLIVAWKPRSPFTYAVRRFKTGVLIETGLRMTDPRFDEAVNRAALAALEVLQGRTEAVSIRLHPEQELD